MGSAGRGTGQVLVLVLVRLRLQGVQGLGGYISSRVTVRVQGLLYRAYSTCSYSYSYSYEHRQGAKIQVRVFPGRLFRLLLGFHP